MLREDLDLLDRALGNLEQKHREIIVRTHLRGEPHARIAADMGCTVRATTCLLNRALVKLAGELDRLQGGK